MIFMETTRLRALLYTPNLRPLFINIHAEHHHIGGGHLIPELSTWFAGRLYVTCCNIKVDSQNLCVYIARRMKDDAIDQTTFFLLGMEGTLCQVGDAGQLRFPIDPFLPTCDETSQVLVFRKAQGTGQFLQLRPRDIRFATQAIQLLRGADV
ncbi:hypothetical protein PILCRDRAFT_92836 [Piloderma croceum F 1598]|uniref:Uncharacterized protein n=1 Tax=Piloderma croceum (strain F 1598) TaxID=765440 RepID=A0A0C3AJ37_PILCF|nr:hypothetical protein PILCRDRAFT_92836 [Piloderma croceum F 1598]